MKDYLLKIKELMRSKKITQKELANKLGKEQQTISNYLNGKTKLDVDTFLEIAKVLDVSPCELLDVDTQSQDLFNPDDYQINSLLLFKKIEKDLTNKQKKSDWFIELAIKHLDLAVYYAQNAKSDELKKIYLDFANYLLRKLINIALDLYITGKNHPFLTFFEQLFYVKKIDKKGGIVYKSKFNIYDDLINFRKQTGGFVALYEKIKLAFQLKEEN